MKRYFIYRAVGRICRFGAKKISLNPCQKFRDGILRSWRFSRNKYVRVLCVRVQVCASIILPFHTFWLGRHYMTSNRDTYLNFHSDLFTTLTIYSAWCFVYRILPFSLSLSLSSSLVVYFLLWLPILIISVSIVPISVCKIQNEDYTFFTKRMYEFSVNEQICGKYYGKKSINPRNIVDYLKFQLSWSVNSVEIAILHLP